MALETKYGMTLSNSEVKSYLSHTKDSIYKLLPLREEGADWKKYLNTVLIEITGFSRLIQNKVDLTAVLSKLEALYTLEDFMLYRSTIFECLNLVDSLG